MRAGSDDLIIDERYVIEELLGRGGMAEVHAGTDRRLHRPVAIKRLLPEMAARADIRTRFETEARTAARLSHPNAVAVYDTGEHEGVPYIVMERLPGETLADRMAAGPVDPEWLRPVALEVLAALAAAHALGIVHRDVKPANILIAADGRAKLADFGIAKSILPADAAVGAQPDPTGTGQWIGTPAYLAPEILEGDAASPRSDLYSLGVVLYEALAGLKPFTGDTPLTAAHVIMGGDHRPLGDARPDLDPDLVATVERALATRPERRFGSAADMAQALQPGSVATAAGAGAGAGGDPTLADLAPTLAGVGTGREGLAGAGTGREGMAGVGPTVTMPPPGLDRGWRTWGMAALACLIVLVAVILVARSDRSGTAAQAPGPSPTTVPAATATTSLAQAIRGLAGRIDASDGVTATAAVRGLEMVADQVERGGGGPSATAVLAAVATWEGAGVLSDDAAAEVTDLLRQVPGANAFVSPATTGEATSPPVTAAPETDNGRGKGKSKSDNDNGGGDED